MIILESANILGSYALKYPHVTRRPRSNRISFLPCDNASSGVIGPRCVYIERISIASKEFALVLFDLSRAFGMDENKKRANINLHPSGCSRPFESPSARIAGRTIVTIHMPDIISSRIFPYLSQ